MKYFLYLFPVLLITVGCGKGRPDGPSGTVTQEQASVIQGYGTTMNTLSDGTKASSFQGQFLNTSNVSSVVKGVTAQETTSCTPTTSGDDTDADSDAVPVNQESSFSCEIGTISISGSFSVSDKDDSVPLPLGGFRFDINSLKLTITGENGSIESTTSGFFESTVAETTITVGAEVETNVKAAGQSADVDYYIDSVATPDDMTSPRGSGSLTLSGFLRMNAPTADFTVQIASVDLTYSSSCSGRFNNGAITYTDGDGNVIKATYTDCSVAWTYNDTALTDI